jgi:hypothetical protein
MRCDLKASILAIVATFALASAANAQTPTKPAHHKRHGHIGFLPPGASGRGTGYRELVGSPGGGVGFYPLPYRIQVGAWRYHMREASSPPWIRNGVLYAMMMDRYRYSYWGATPVNSYRYGVFDPFEGVGTPFSGGFYGPAGDEDEPAFPFGRTYGPK